MSQPMDQAGRDTTLTLCNARRHTPGDGQLFSSGTAGSLSLNHQYQIDGFKYVLQLERELCSKHAAQTSQRMPL